jgi:phospholipase/lecithinase/hemolysin
MRLINQTNLGLPATLLFGAPSDDVVPPYMPATQSLNYSKIYAFGDSLTDAGNVYIATLGKEPTSAVYSDGRFSNGAVWVQDLAKDFGLPAVTPSLAGGTDFAFGGAEAGPEPLGTSRALTDLPSQLVQFLAEDPKPTANALYALSIGANDLNDAIPTYRTDPLAAVIDIHAAVNDETAFVAGLAVHGAHNFVILNVPNLGLTPEGSGPGAALATELSAFYDRLLKTSLMALAAKDHLNIHLINTFQLIDEAVADPAHFGLTNVTDPVWTGNFTNSASGTFNATGAAQKGYLFFDHLHPTAAGHQVIASVAFDQLR